MSLITQSAVTMIANLKPVFFICSGASGRPLYITELHFVDSVFCKYSDLRRKAFQAELNLIAGIEHRDKTGSCHGIPNECFDCQIQRCEKVNQKAGTSNRFQRRQPSDFSALFSAFEAAPLVRPTGVFSHLAAPEDEAFTALQRERFDRMTERLAERCPGLTRHLSASGGFLKGLFYDMVRIGILLYGYAPFPAAFAVRPAMRVSAPVSACRYVEEGERVFYGRQQKKESGYLSVVRFGYADGLPRKDGIFRCMDVSAAEKRMKIGSFTDILNKNANEIAAKYDTISYEVLVGAAKRAERIYEE